MLNKSLLSVAALVVAQSLPGLGRAIDEQQTVRVTTSEIIRPGELANIHLDWHEQPPSSIKAIYTSCDGQNSTKSVQTIGRSSSDGEPPRRLAWAVPDHAPTQQCIYIIAVDDTLESPKVLGKSDPISLQKPLRKRSTADANIPLLKDFDSLGTWFDGVAKIEEKVKQGGGVTCLLYTSDAADEMD